MFLCIFKHVFFPHYLSWFHPIPPLPLHHIEAQIIIILKIYINFKKIIVCLSSQERSRSFYFQLVFYGF